MSARKRIRSAVRAPSNGMRACRWLHGEVTDGVVPCEGSSSDCRSARPPGGCPQPIGVRDVVNEIMVAHAPFRDTSRPTLRRRFAGVGVDGHRIGVETADGVVAVAGVVPTFAMLEDIEHTLRSIRGVTRINNQLLVA